MTPIAPKEANDAFKRDAIATVFGAFGQQVGNKAAGAGSKEAFSVDEL